MSGKASERGEIRLRSLVEISMICLLVYAAVHIGPAVKLRIDFVNAMQIAANSPIEKTAGDIKMDLINKAEGIGIALFSENIHVIRNVAGRKTVVTVYYDIHISFLPQRTYIWHIRDQVEARFL